MPKGTVDVERLRWTGRIPVKLSRFERIVFVVTSITSGRVNYPMDVKPLDIRRTFF
jgi:hypothetical protein